MKENLKALLQNQLVMLDDLLENFNADVLTKRSLKNKWSVFENIAHMGRYNEIFLLRMYEVQHKNNPSFERYVADNEDGFIEWTSRPVDLVIVDYRLSRETVIRYFQSLSEDDLKRTGMHPKFGELTMIEWLEFYLLHEAHHLFTIFKLLHSKE